MLNSRNKKDLMIYFELRPPSPPVGGGYCLKDYVPRF
jgi:hypothetical protein